MGMLPGTVGEAESPPGFPQMAVSHGLQLSQLSERIF